MCQKNANKIDIMIIFLELRQMAYTFYSTKTRHFKMNYRCNFKLIAIIIQRVDN